MTDRLLIRAIQWFAAAGCAALVAAPIWDHWRYRDPATSARGSVADEFVSPAHAAPRPTFIRPAGTALAAPGPMAVIGGLPAIASIVGPAPDVRPAPSAAPPQTGAPPVATAHAVAGAASAPPREPTTRATSAVTPRPDRPVPGGAVPLVIASVPMAAPGNPSPGPGQAPPPADPAPARPSDPGTPAGGQDTVDDNPDPQAPPTRLTLLPTRAAFARGEVVAVKVNLSDALGVTSVPFHLKFDPARLEYLGARTGSAFNGTSLQPILMVAENPDRPGDVAFGLVLAGASSAYSGSGDLAILEFRALQAGASDLLIEEASIRGPISEPLAAEIESARLHVY